MNDCGKFCKDDVALHDVRGKEREKQDAHLLLLCPSFVRNHPRLSYLMGFQQKALVTCAQNFDVWNKSDESITEKFRSNNCISANTDSVRNNPTKGIAYTSCRVLSCNKDLNFLHNSICLMPIHLRKNSHTNIYMTNIHVITYIAGKRWKLSHFQDIKYRWVGEKYLKWHAETFGLWAKLAKPNGFKI